MSGIEIAGLVLAVFPLIISGVKCYHEGVSTFNVGTRFRHELSALETILATEEAKFLNTCKLLLDGLVSPRELAFLLKKPGGPAWKDPRLQAKLATVLYHAAPSFWKILEDMNDTLTHLKIRLDFDPDGKVSRNDLFWGIVVGIVGMGS